jgi:hypothetical protein
VRFEVLTAANMKIADFLVVALYSLVEILKFYEVLDMLAASIISNYC